ncbi:MAG: hypothetical protein QOG09_1587 [Solirubrobacterales bacterium]|jgi:hypothetical protein|nr:hypothetical protein [Solirubrobacterales bacterium]
MRRAIVILVLAGLFAVLAGRWAVAPPSISARATSAGKHKAADLAISGRIESLSPGTQRPLALRVANRHAFQVELHWVGLSSGDASEECLASQLALTNFQGHVKIPGSGARNVRVPIEMLAGAPDSCQDATFPLSFKARARKA